MSTIKDGGPAFPVGDQSTHPLLIGMSLRDWFAGMALQGMLAADSSYSGPRWSGVGTDERYQRGGGKWVDPAGVSRQAYEIADAILAAREETE